MTLTLEFRCSACGQHHRIPVDASGHYSGPLPCDPTTHIELQVEHADLRAHLETAHANAKH